MPVDNSGLHTQPRPRPAIEHETDESGGEVIESIRQANAEALSDFWRPITPADLRPPAGKPFVPLNKRPRREVDPTRGNWSARLHDAFKPYHELLGSKAVAGARAELLTKIEAAQEAADAVYAVDGEREAERAAYVAEARAEAATGGPGTDAPARRDWEAIRAARMAVFQDRLAEATKAANTYRATVASEAPQRLDTVLKEVELRRAKALAAVRSVAADVKAAATAAEAVHQIEKEFGITGSQGWHQWTSEERSIHTKAVRDLQGLDRYLARSDETATGRWILDESPSLPLHTREVLAEASGGTRKRWMLGQAELDDELNGRPAVTSFHSPDDAYDKTFAAEHLTKRSIPR